MTRERALEISRLLCRIEQLESQFDYFYNMPAEHEQEIQISHELPAYGFSQEDMFEHIQIVKDKLKEAKQKLKEI